MRSATALGCLLLLAAAYQAASLDLLDLSSWVEALTGAGAGVEKWKRPEFCGKMECPPFKRKERTDNFELRRYDAGKWVQTSVNDSAKWELAYTRGVSRLLKYFKGGNTEEKTFDVTTPTLGELVLHKEGLGDSKPTYNFSMWLPEELQKDTPQPTDAELQIIDYPKIDVYVRVFGGFATENAVRSEADNLMNLLDEDGRDFGDDVVWVAVYDPVQKLLERHNEVHIPASKQQKKDRAEEQAVPAS